MATARKVTVKKLKGTDRVRPTKLQGVETGALGDSLDLSTAKVPPLKPGSLSTVSAAGGEVPRADIIRSRPLSQQVEEREMKQERVNATRKAVVKKAAASKPAPKKKETPKKHKVSVKRKRNMQEIVDEIEAGRGAQYIKD